MNLKKFLIAATALIAMASSHVARADYAFGYSSGLADNALVITTTTGTYTVSSNPTGAASNVQGWWGAIDPHLSGNSNYFAGIAGGEYRNYFTFNLRGADIQGAILSAFFQVNAYEVSGSGNYTLWDITSSLDAVRASATGTASDADIFNDLGSGVSFGNLFLSGPNSFQLVNVAFGSDGLLALENALQEGEFGIGGTFGAAAAVPEPESLAILGLGLVALAATRRKKV